MRINNFLYICIHFIHIVKISVTNRVVTIVIMTYDIIMTIFIIPSVCNNVSNIIGKIAIHLSLISVNHCLP